MENLTRKLQIITHPSTLQSARKVPIHSANPSTIFQSVHYILTMSALKLGGSL